MRTFVGAKFGHQGRNAQTGYDCGGLVLVAGREKGLTSVEFLGYASFPTDGTFEELLEANTKFRGKYAFPFNFTGKEMQSADLVSFDYGNGEGTRHLALVTCWDGRRYRVLEAQPNYGVCEHALASPFVGRKTVLKVWGIKGLRR